MKFETVRIHFLSDVLICCHPEILLPWQRDVTTSPLYYLISETIPPRKTIRFEFSPELPGFPYKC